MSTRTVVPASLAHVYLKDFGNNLAGAAEYAGISVYALKRCLQATLMEDWQAEALLKACYNRLGKEVTDRIVHPLSEPTAPATAPAKNGTVPVAEAPVVTVETSASESEVASLVLKPCKQCKQDKPATLEYFGRNQFALDGLQGLCRACWREQARLGGLKAQANGRAERERLARAAEAAAVAPAPTTPASPAVVLADAPVSASLLAIAAEVERLENEVAALKAENERLRSWAQRAETLVREIGGLKEGQYESAAQD